MKTSARYYDASTGEFLSPDPLEFVDGMSKFRAYFVAQNIDPFGNQVGGGNSEGAYFDCSSNVNDLRSSAKLLDIIRPVQKSVELLGKFLPVEVYWDIKGGGSLEYKSCKERCSCYPEVVEDVDWINIHINTTILAGARGRPGVIVSIVGEIGFNIFGGINQRFGGCDGDDVGSTCITVEFFAMAKICVGHELAVEACVGVRGKLSYSWCGLDEVGDSGWGGSISFFGDICALGGMYCYSREWDWL